MTTRLERIGTKWCWQILDADGEFVAQGVEKTRLDARRRGRAVIRAMLDESWGR